jgi:hypothetical protein
MSDNTQVLNPNAIRNGGGDIISTDDLGGVKVQRVKMMLGGDGVNEGDVSLTNPMPVDIGLNQPLTDAELRASPVPVSGPLTDAELRAVAVPVSGTVTANTGLTQPLTDTQLRASPVDVDVLFDPSNMSAFGTLESSDLTPVVQMDFVYGINTQTGASTVANGGTVGTNASRLLVQSNTSATGSAIFNSRRVAKYRAGQGVTARFTAAFTTGVANSQQLVGVGTSSDGYFVGFNGASFGIAHRNAGGVTYVAQASWNGDTCNGAGASGFTINPTFGNVWMVKYPFLGYGNITFWVLNPATSRWILAHTIRYPNTTTAVQLANPNLFFWAESVNTGATTNQLLYVGSVGIFISGPRSFIGNPKWASDNNKTGVTAETNLLSIRNATTYNGVTNRSLIRLNSISIACSNAANAVATIIFRIGATVGGVPAFTTVNGTTANNGVTITSGNSVASVDTAGTTASAGTYIYNINAAGNTSSFLDLAALEIFIAPGETLTVSGKSTSSATLGAAVNWTEDI